MKRHRYSQEQYEKLISAYEKGTAVSVACEVLGILPDSGRTIIRNFVKHGKRSPKSRGGKNRVIYDKERIISAIKGFYLDPNNSDATLKEIQEYLLSPSVRTVLPFWNGSVRCPSAAWLGECLNHELLFTLKIATPSPSSRNSFENKVERKKFAEWLLCLDPRRLVFIDEHGFNLWCRRSRARSKKGDRVTIPVTIQKMVNCSVIG